MSQVWLPFLVGSGMHLAVLDTDSKASRMSPSSLPLRDPLCCFSGRVSYEPADHQEPAITINTAFSGSIHFVICCPNGSFHKLASTWATLFPVYFFSSWCSKLDFLASCRLQIVQIQKRMTRDGKHQLPASQSLLHDENLCIAQTPWDKWTNVSGGSGHHPGEPKGLIMCWVSHWLRSYETNIMYVDYISKQNKTKPHTVVAELIMGNMRFI